MDDRGPEHRSPTRPHGEDPEGDVRLPLEVEVGQRAANGLGRPHALEPGGIADRPPYGGPRDRTLLATQGTTQHAAQQYTPHGCGRGAAGITALRRVLPITVSVSVTGCGCASGQQSDDGAARDRALESAAALRNVCVVHVLSLIFLFY